MNNFLKSVLATVVGILIFCVVAAGISVVGLVGMVAAASSTTSTVEDGSVLVLNLKGTLQEQSSDASPLSMLQGDDSGNLGLADMMAAIRKAKSSKKIKGIYIEANGMVSDLAQAQELRDALAGFKKSGKWIIAFGEQFNTNDYYIASIADKIYINPQGSLQWQGLGTKLVFLKDLFKKVGVNTVAFKCGKYKSATETFTGDKMSEPSREQAQRFLDGSWNTIVDAVSASRGIGKEDLNRYADEMMTFESASVLVKDKFFDGLLYNDEIKGVIRSKLSLGKDDDIPQATVDDIMATPGSNSGDEVAVYYAYGEIVNQEPSGNIYQNTHYIVGSDMCKDMQDLAKDDDVKAVVIRVNSPGGSSYDSEQIWHAIEQLKKARKPVVVSMGGYAASGGYYISCGADYIFAEPTTITGSIGIFGLVQDGAEMASKLGLKFDGVETNRNSSMGMSAYGLLLAPLNQEQGAKLQGAINRGYNLFKSRVAAGRKMSMEAVEERAQGHVFLGEDALKLKLVDALGGMDKAVAKAAQLARLKEYHTVDYPGQSTLLSKLLDDGGKAKGTLLDDRLQQVLGQYYMPFMVMSQARSMGIVQARLPYLIINN